MLRKAHLTHKILFSFLLSCRVRTSCHSCESSIPDRAARHLLCLDNKSFNRGLSKRRDSGFFTFGELCRYLRKLCSRCILPKHTPADTDWSGLLQISLDDCRELSCPDFLSRLKLRFDLEEAARAQVRKDHAGRKNLRSVIDGLTEEVKDAFATQAREYIVFVLDSLLKDIRLTAGIVRGMASFDLTVLLTQPMDQDLFCFRALYHSFQIRGWVQEADEIDYREEYVEFLDQLRNTHGHLRTADLVPDVVDLFVSLPALRNRLRVFHLFRLSCLCVTESSPTLPAIRFQGADSSDPNCRLSTILLPSQSFLTTVPNSVASCVTEAALGRFRELEARFDSGNVSGNPWSHVDAFGQSKFYKSLLASYRIQGHEVSPVKVDRSRSSSVVDENSGSTFRSPGKTVCLAHDGYIPAAEVTKTVKEIQGGSANH